MCTTCVSGACGNQKKVSYAWLWVTVWVLGTKPRSYVRAPLKHAYRSSLKTLVRSFLPVVSDWYQLIDFLCNLNFFLVFFYFYWLSLDFILDIFITVLCRQWSLLKILSVKYWEFPFSRWLIRLSWRFKFWAALLNCSHVSSHIRAFAACWISPTCYGQ